ncbi:MAG: metallophosphoesterase [Ginsengibacter sp.]
MRTPLGALIFIAIMVLLDVYVFQAVKAVSYNGSSKTRAIVYGIYWAISILAIICFLIFVFARQETLPKPFRTYLLATEIGLFFAKFIAVVFFMVDDLRRLIQWASGKIFFSNTEGEELSDGISRSAFLSWLGLAAGGSLFSTLVYGFSNKYDYQIKNIDLSFDNLPAAFKGLKVVHISDIHSGSFANKAAVNRGIDKILALNPDLIIFSGDLVNDRSEEMTDYIDSFSRLKAPMGVYSTLGNHDYGDYAAWPYNGISKPQNLEILKQTHAKLGWRLLMNEHVELNKGDDKIALIGIENWSAKARFPKYGDMAKAYKGSENYPFKILISHDPSHWDAQVRSQYPDVDLMLSGHTHGMQFGVEIPGFKWSPVQYVYKQWAGLYEKDKQKLYINRGYGFIGYPGRVGILPEITLLNFV